MAVQLGRYKTKYIQMKKMDKCSFCGRDKKDVSILIAGMEGHICENCIEQAHAIIEEEFKKNKSFDLAGVELKKPKEIKDFLDHKGFS